VSFRETVAAEGSSVADKSYDVIVVGGGPGGYTAAIRAAQLGLETACVEEDRRFGGTCLLRGCIPTKALLHAADLLTEIQSAKRSGIRVGEVELDFGAVMKSKSDTVTKNAKGIDFLFKKNEVSPERGRGFLRGPNTVEVVEDGKSRTLTARQGIILAMGSRPREIGACAVDGKHIVTSDHILELGEIPKRLGVLGAGAVGTEFASIYHRFGSETTLIEMLPNVLPVEDDEISQELEKALKKQGIDVRTGAALKSAKVAKDCVQLVVERDGKSEQLEVDMLLVSVGRAPNVENCGLEGCGISLERGFVAVDEYQRTSVAGVWAIGDITPGPMLAHKASAEGIVAAETIAAHPTRPIDHDKVPGATYCHPEVASVGLSEATARARGYEVAVGKFPWAASGKARILQQTTGFIKIVRETKYDEILGIHIIGPHATDLLGEACALIGLEATNEELTRIVHPHPTLAEGMHEAAHAAAGHPLAF
jgi:dihydrolipoamide dehydrogenase